jgi:putative acetyltransferase
VSELLAQSDAVAARLYPGEYRCPIDGQYLARAATHVLLARLDGIAVGLCVVFDRDDKTVEIKRMIVAYKARGKGIGSALLEAAYAHAIDLGACAVMLEVGTRNIEAQALYRSAGYLPRAPFPPYTASPISLFMKKLIDTPRSL